MASATVRKRSRSHGRLTPNSEQLVWIKAKSRVGTAIDHFLSSEPAPQLPGHLRPRVGPRCYRRGPRLMSSTVKPDRPRYLARRSEKLYTRDSAQGMRGELEPISASEQEQQSARVHRREQEGVIAAWLQTVTTIDEALTRFESVARIEQRQRARSGLRAVRRATESVGRTLAG